MQTVTLAKALNIKNRLVGQKNWLIQTLYKCNSRKDTTKINYNVQELFEMYCMTINNIIAVKTALAKANTRIYQKIYTIAELRSKISELLNMSTREEEERRRIGYSEEYEVEKWVVTYTDADVSKMVSEMQVQIETLQDEIDAYNHSHTIQIPE